MSFSVNRTPCQVSSHDEPKTEMTFCEMTQIKSRRAKSNNMFPCKSLTHKALCVSVAGWGERHLCGFVHVILNMPRGWITAWKKIQTAFAGTEVFELRLY